MNLTLRQKKGVKILCAVYTVQTACLVGIAESRALKGDWTACAYLLVCGTVIGSLVLNLLTRVQEKK